MVTIESIQGKVKTKEVQCQKPSAHIGCCMANISLSPPQVELAREELFGDDDEGD